MKNIVIVVFWVKFLEIWRNVHTFSTETYMNIIPRVHEHKTFVQAWMVRKAYASNHPKM